MSVRTPVFELLNNIKHCSTMEEYIKEGKLDYTIEKVDLAPKATWNTSGDVVMPHHVGVMRVGKTGREAIMGNVGREYGLIQPRDIVEFCDEFKVNGKAEFYAAGAPNFGEEIFVIMKQPEFIDLGGDAIHAYFCVTSSHDGKGAMNAIPLYLREVNQTVIVPPHHGKDFHIKHSKNAMERVIKARRLIGKMVQYWEDCTHNFKRFSKVQLTQERAEQYFMLVFPGTSKDSTRAQNVRDKIMGLYTDYGIGCKLPTCRGTLLGAMMAVVEYADYYQVVKKSKHRDEVTARIHSRIEGSAAELKVKAINMSIKFEKMGSMLRV